LESLKKTRRIQKDRYDMADTGVPAFFPDADDPITDQAKSLPTDWATPPAPGEIITSEATGNTYTMGEKIGEGHFGLVFGCVDVWNNELAAKVMKPLGPYEKVKQSRRKQNSRNCNICVTHM
jgi:hypothetical protein